MGLVNPLAGLTTMFAGGKNLKDSRFYRGATTGTGGYTAAQLNKMNALGGYYSEPARQQRRTQSRIENLLARKAAGKSYSQKNLNTLTLNQGPAGITPKAPTGGDAAPGTGFSRPSRPDRGATRSPGTTGQIPGSHHMNRGGLAGLWQR